MNKIITVQGVEVPSLGYGTFRISGDECERGVEHALSVGYRHFDTAQAYDNEDRVGAAMETAGVPREEVFLTTKLQSDSVQRDRVGPSTDESLRELRTDYVDLLLIHWPHEQIPMAETLEAMRELQEAGKVRHVGVSNFPRSLVEQAMEHATIFCDQVEYHPFLGQKTLLGLATEHDFLLTAFAPLAQGEVMSDSTLQEIAASHGATTAQVALRWLVVQDHVAAIPKAASPERIESNFDALELNLSDEELWRIDGLERGGRVVDPPFAPDWEE